MATPATLTVATVTAHRQGNCFDVSYTVNGISGTLHAFFPANFTEQQIRDQLQIIIDDINSVDDVTLASDASTLNTALTTDTFS